MLDQISFQTAQARQWDVVIVGSSFAALFFALGLPRNTQVLFVEKGVVEPDSQTLATQGRTMETIAQTNTSGLEKNWVSHALFGGNSNYWWGQTPRFHPDDFQTASLFGQGEDWPLSYAELEPYYAEVEAMMEVNGSPSAALPRSTPFPYPPHVPTRTEAYFRARDPGWIAAPSARSTGGSRPPCCANGICNICPIGARFSIPNAIERLARPGMALLSEAEVRAVVIEAGRATGVSTPKGEIRGNVIAVAANALHTPAILMRSDLTLPALGRYLHEQPAQYVTLDLPIPGLFGGTSITGHGYGLYSGAFRREHAGVLIEIFNVPAKIRPERGRLTHRVSLKLIAEDLPKAENRVMLGTDGAAHITWTGHSDYARQGLARAIERLPEVIPTDIEAVIPGKLTTTEAHIQGTTRMGADADTSVVDKRCQVHGVQGLLALGAGAFPTGSAANPTLTLSALSLMAGRAL